MTPSVQLCCPVRQLETCECCGDRLSGKPAVLALRQDGFYDVLDEKCGLYVFTAAWQTAEAEVAQNGSKSL